MDDVVNKNISHHGIKGQKWGVRKDKGYEGKRAKTKKIEKLDKKFDQNRSMLNTYIKINNIAAKQSNAVDVPRINNKPKYKDQDFTRDTPLRRQYYKEHQKAHMDNLEAAAKSLGTNASGTKRYGIIENDDGSWLVTLRDVKHTIGIDEFVVRPKLDKTGHIIKLELDDEPLFLEQSSDVTDFLAHFGIKGQKWGVRNKRGHGGRKPATALNKKFEDKSYQRLSDAELNKRIKRMELEKRYSDLNNASNPKVKRGEGLAGKVIKTVGEQTSTRLLNDLAYYGGKQATKAILKKSMGEDAAEKMYTEMFPKKKK